MKCVVLSLFLQFLFTLPNALELSSNSTANFLSQNQASLTIRECTFQDLSGIKAWLIDLDGTIYGWDGLLPGAVQFFDWLKKSSLSYVLVSNSLKTREGVVAKFKRPKFYITQEIDVDKVYTVGAAMGHYMATNVPFGAKVFAFGTSAKYADGTDESLPAVLKRLVPSGLFDSWNIKSDMEVSEVVEWADSALKGEYVCIVVAFGDGFPKSSYILMSKMTILLRNGAHLLVAGPDIADSHPRDKKYPNVDMTFPSLGGYEQLLMASAELRPGTVREQFFHANVGKGGNMGSKYMMEPSFELLLRQNSRLRKEEVIIIGDNFGTDIAAGNKAGIKSMLVLSGAHDVSDAQNWEWRPNCFLESIGKIAQIMDGSNAK